MFKLTAAKHHSGHVFRLCAFAIGAFTFSLAFSPSALAAPPTQLFPFFPIPPAQYAQIEAPPQVQLAPSDDQGIVYEMPARLRRQVVNYPTREAAGTVIIDTPNTYLY